MRTHYSARDVFRFIKDAEVVEDTGCIEWSGYRDKDGYGYGMFGGRRGVRLHRLSYELFVGDIPDGMLVCHTCDNPSCVNPEHLFLGTALDNMKDMVRKGRQGNRGYSKATRNGGMNSPVRKINAVDVMDIRESSERGEHPKSIASRYGLSTAHVYGIISRKFWKSVA